MATDVGALQIKIYAGIAQLQNDMDKANKVVSGFATRTEATLGRVKSAFNLIGAGASLTVIKRMADEYAKFDTQLKLATRSTIAYKQAYKDVVAISKASQNDIGATGILYSRLMRASQSAGIAQSGVAKMTETVSLALRATNASAQEASSTMLQLSQAFGKGKLDGQEFAAVAEASPILLEQLAKSMKVPYEQLIILREQGKLTREEMRKAFTDHAFIAGLQAQAKEIRTIGAAQTYFINQLKLFIGENDKAIGVSRFFSESIRFLADNLEYLAKGALVFAIAQMVKFGQARVATMQQDMVASRQMVANAQAEAVALKTKELAEQSAIIKTRELSISKAQSVLALAQAKKLEAEASLASVVGTGKETAAKEILYHANIKLLQSQQALAKAQGLSLIGFNNNAKAVTQMSAKLSTVPTQMTAISRASALATTAVRGFGVAVNALGGWVGIAITAVVLFGDKLYNLYQQVRGLTPEIEQLNAEFEKSRQLSAQGIDSSNIYAGELEQIKKLQVARDDLFKKLKFQSENYQKNQGKGIFAVSKDELDKTAELYVMAINKVKIAETNLGVQIKENNTVRKDANGQALLQYNELTSSIKTVSSVMEEYKSKIAEVKRLGAEAGISEAKIAENVKALQRERDKELKSIQGAVKATKEQKEVEQEINQLLANRIRASEQIADNARVLELLKEGMDLSEAQFRVEQARDGILEEQTEKLIEQQKAQKKLLDNVEEMKEAEKDRLKGIEENARAWREWHDESIRLVRESEEEKRAEYERTAQTMQNSISDALLRGFERGRSIAENFKFTLLNMFKTIVLQPMINFATAPLSRAIAGVSTGLFGGNAMASGGGNFDLFESGSSFFDLIKKGNQGIISSIESLGASISNGMGGIRDQIGGFLGQHSSQITDALGIAGSLYSAYKFIKDDNYVGAALTGVGYAIGGAVGGAIGSAIGSLFGGKKLPPKAKTELPELATGFNQQLGGFLQAIGGGNANATDSYYLGRSGGSGYGQFNANINGQDLNLHQKYGEYGEESLQEYIKYVLGEGIVKGIQLSGVTQGVKNLFSGLTDNAVITNMMNATIALNNSQEQLAKTFGLTVDQASAVATSTGLAGDNLANFVATLAQTAQSMITPAQALIKARDTLTEMYGGVLPDTLDLFDARLKAIDKNKEAGLQEFTKLFGSRDAFGNFTAQRDAIKTGVRGAQYNLMTPAEKFAHDTKSLKESFGKFGLTVPQTQAELRSFGDSIDLTTENGIELAMAYPLLVEQFMAVIDPLTQLTTTVSETARAFDNLNTKDFNNVVDFNRAKALQAQGINQSVGVITTPTNGDNVVLGSNTVVNTPVSSVALSYDALLAEVKLLRQEISMLQLQNKNTAQNTKNMETILRRVSNDGNSIFTTEVA